MLWLNILPHLACDYCNDYIFWGFDAFCASWYFIVPLYDNLHAYIILCSVFMYFCVACLGQNTLDEEILNLKSLYFLVKERLYKINELANDMWQVYL